MLSKLQINNFQSLAHVELELKPFTVIVGKSSSGKSALARAVQTLTSNRRGHSFITHGEKLCTITATMDRGTVTLRRGKSTDDNEYIVVPTDPADPNYPQRAYSKLGATTPEEVSEFIGIDSKDAINYAGQFDKPYLLGDDTSGGQVARVLGELTNVSVIFEAARESNRRKLNQAGQLKTRATDLAAIKAKVPSYAPIKEQRAALSRAELDLEHATYLQTKLERLTNLIETIEVADVAITSLTARAAIQLPDASRITEAADQLTQYRRVVSDLSAASREAKSAQDTIDELDRQIAIQQETYAMSLDTLADSIRDHLEGNAVSLATYGEEQNPTIEIHEAAQLSADYIVKVLS